MVSCIGRTMLHTVAGVGRRLAARHPARRPWLSDAAAFESLLGNDAIEAGVVA